MPLTSTYTVASQTIGCCLVTELMSMRLDAWLVHLRGAFSAAANPAEKGQR
jgi:hypothetical protein